MTESELARGVRGHTRSSCASVCVPRTRASPLRAATRAEHACTHVARLGVCAASRVRLDDRRGADPHTHGGTAWTHDGARAAPTPRVRSPPTPSRNHRGILSNEMNCDKVDTSRSGRSRLRRASSCVGPGRSPPALPRARSRRTATAARRVEGLAGVARLRAIVAQAFGVGLVGFLSLDVATMGALAVRRRSARAHTIRAAPCVCAPSAMWASSNSLACEISWNRISSPAPALAVRVAAASDLVVQDRPLEARPLRGARSPHLTACRGRASRGSDARCRRSAGGARPAPFRKSSMRARFSIFRAPCTSQPALKGVLGVRPEAPPTACRGSRAAAAADRVRVHYRLQARGEAAARSRVGDGVRTVRLDGGQPHAPPPPRALGWPSRGPAACPPRRGPTLLRAHA